MIRLWSDLVLMFKFNSESKSLLAYSVSLKQSERAIPSSFTFSIKSRSKSSEVWLCSSLLHQLGILSLSYKLSMSPKPMRSSSFSLKIFLIPNSRYKVQLIQALELLSLQYEEPLNQYLLLIERLNIISTKVRLANCEKIPSGVS